MPLKENEITFTLNLEKELDEANVDFDDREQATYAASEIAVEEIAKHMERQQSPVSGYGKFAKLDKEYKDYKKKITGNTKANLRLTGNLLSNIFIEDNDETQFTIAVDHLSCPYAHNHLVGDTVPMRRFLPDDSRGENFNKKIISKIKDELEKFRSDKKIQIFFGAKYNPNSLSDFRLNDVKVDSNIIMKPSPKGVTEKNFLETLAEFRASQEEKEAALNFYKFFKMKDVF